MSFGPSRDRDAAPLLDGISVVTATRNRRDRLLRKAEAMARQTLARTRWEWIVAFDGAQDEIERDLRAAVGDDLPLRTVTIEPSGPGPARDAAARMARFSVLYLSDDDCLPAPNALALHLAAQAVPAVYLGTVVFEHGSVRDERSPPRNPGWWHLGGANASLPTTAFRSVGGFGTLTIGYGGEDLWLGRRLARAGTPVRPLSTARVRHLGPDPQRSGDGRRAFQAGANAVRLARRDPPVAWRLGVHPVLLVAKEAWLRTPFALGDATRAAYEREYARGARQAWRQGRASDERR